MEAFPSLTTVSPGNSPVVGVFSCASAAAGFMLSAEDSADVDVGGLVVGIFVSMNLTPLVAAAAAAFPALHRKASPVKQV